MTNTEANEKPHGSDELAASLAKARKAARLTQTELAERAGWVKSGKTKVSKIEGKKQLPDSDDLDAWAAATGTSDRLREQWKSLAAQADALRSNYRKRAAGGQQPVQAGYNERAEKTTHFRFFEMTFIPRYLQVPDYSRLVLGEHHEKHGTVDDVEAATGERQGSVRYLYDADKAFVFLIDEPVLRRRRVPPKVMRQQLDRLLSVIGLSNVTLAIYPSLSEPVGSFTEGSFELFDDNGYMETPLDDEHRYLADDVETFERLFERYWQDAVTGDKARQVILDAIAALPAE